MYNKFLTYLLDNSPKKTISKHGTLLRKIINPVIRFAIPFTTKTKFRIIRRAKMPNGPVIFCSTHGFKEDIVDAVVIAKKQSYILIGSLSQVFYSFDGIASWANGCILVDRLNKESRKSCKEKMIRALNLGSSILIFPEGTWNKSPNQMTSGLFPGFYDVAISTGAPIAVIATHREGDYVYGVLDEAFYISEYSREEAVEILRDKMSTLRWELMEKYSSISRSTLPYNEEADAYWKTFIDDLMAEVEFYDYEDELHTKYVDKAITEPKDVFSHLAELTPTIDNAFLFNKRLK